MSKDVPIRDMRDTASFLALVNQEREVTVTRNGYDAIHCLSTEQYQHVQEELAKARLLSRMMRAESELADGKYSDFDEFSDSMSQKYGL